jgi:CRP-like cAMP-binding protein
MELTQALEQMKKFLFQVHLLADNEWNDLALIWKPYDAKRKTLLTRAGETERYLYFVLDGIQRGFYAHDDGREATIVFSYPFSFSGIADSFLTQHPSRFFLETLTASSFLRTEHKQFNELMLRYPNLQTAVFKMLSFIFAGVLERQIELQCFSAEEKFKTLLTRSPHVLNLIPHKYLASYLGIDATNFSKLLGSVRL